MDKGNRLLSMRADSLNNPQTLPVIETFANLRFADQGGLPRFFAPPTGALRKSLLSRLIAMSQKAPPEHF